MGEDLDTSTNEPDALAATPEAAAEKPVLENFKYVLVELLKKAQRDPEQMARLLADFALTFLEQYDDQLSQQQKDEVFYSRADYLKSRN